MLDLRKIRIDGDGLNHFQIPSGQFHAGFYHLQEPGIVYFGIVQTGNQVPAGRYNTVIIIAVTIAAKYATKAGSIKK